MNFRSLTVIEGEQGALGSPGFPFTVCSFLPFVAITNPGLALVLWKSGQTSPCNMWSAVYATPSLCEGYAIPISGNRYIGGEHPCTHSPAADPVTLCISTDARDPAFSNRHSSSGPTVGTLWTFPSEISSCEWVGGGDLGRWKGQDEKTVKRTVTIVYNHLQSKLVPLTRALQS